MNFIGAVLPVTGHCFQTDDGETVIRMHCRALPGGNVPHWISSDGNGTWFECQPAEAEAYEAEYTAALNLSSGFEVVKDLGR